jgi:hypothetical protein
VHWSCTRSLLHPLLYCSPAPPLIVLPLRFPGSQGKQYFLGLEAIFKGSGNPAYPGEQSVLPMLCYCFSDSSIICEQSCQTAFADL